MEIIRFDSLSEANGWLTIRQKEIKLLFQPQIVVKSSEYGFSEFVYISYDEK